MKLKAASVQFNVCPGQREENLRHGERLLREAAEEGAQLIVLPELWTTGFDMQNVAEQAEDGKSDTLALLRQLAQEYHVCICGGSIAERRSDGIYNTMFVISTAGRVIAKYRKTHLFSQLDEDKYFSAGLELEKVKLTVDRDAVTIGLSICYDLRFPEMYRNLVLRGAQILVVAAAWPATRQNEFELFCRSRAAENRAFVVAANYTDTIGNIYQGGSMIVAPDGDLLAYGGNFEGVVSATLDTDLLYDPRYFNSLNDRQPFIDEIDDNLL